MAHLNNNQDIVSLAKFIGATTIQLCGESGPKDAKEVKKEMPHTKIIKSIHIVDEGSVAGVKKYLAYVDDILLDTMNKKISQLDNGTIKF